jgi:hypothetical protein
MGERLAVLNDELERDWDVRIEIRTGVNTGEIVAGDPSAGQRLVTGDAVNVAARLEQAAQPGEVLIGQETYLLVRDAVEAAPVEPLSVKGKTGELTPLRLLSVVSGAAGFARRFESPLVGRAHELELLRQAYRRAVDEQSCHLFTVLGSAGIGKSRLTQEFVGGHAEAATVLTGHCLSYGEGITYWPLVEILEQLGSEQKLVELLEGEEDAQAIVNSVFVAVGHAEGLSSPEETPWAVRKLLEALAREQPLVLVLEDLQWAEPTFLDLVDHIADWSRDAPILLLCVARPELLDERADWGGGKLNATSILLESLSDAAAETLIENLLGGAELGAATRSRISAAAEGNPLFVEQMLAMLNEDNMGDGAITVPPTIQALLAARLDNLDLRERAAIERAAVVGKEFWLRAVADLASEPAEIAPALQLLVRKELIRPHRSKTFPREDAFRFRHILIRDAAYAAMPKELLAELHERFAAWLEGERSEIDEIVGYHLEQAYRYRGELGPLDEHGRELGRRAGERLAIAGERALARFDMPAAAKLPERALAVLPTDHARRNELRLSFADAVAQEDLERAARLLDELVLDVQRAGEVRLEWRARVAHAAIRVLTEGLPSEEALDLSEAAVAKLGKLGDEAGVARAWRVRADACNISGDEAGLEAAIRQALVHARNAADVRMETELMFWLGLTAFHGALPPPEAQAVCVELEQSATTPLQRAHALFWTSALNFLGGDSEARNGVLSARAIDADLGLKLLHGASSMPLAQIELLRGDLGSAERILREGDGELEETGERGYRSTLTAMLTEVLLRQGRDDEAEEVMGTSEALTAPDDILNVAYHVALRANVAARRGESAAAVRGANQAIAAIEGMPYATFCGEILMLVADALRRVGRPSEARAAASQALELYERKGVAVAVEDARAFLSERLPT